MELYTGTVSHARMLPVKHTFSYEVSMMMVDITALDEAPQRGWWPLAGINTGSHWWPVAPAAAFNEDDHMKDWRRADAAAAAAAGRPPSSLADCVRDAVRKATGKRPGPGARIKILTHLQYFGYCFNPISVYYVYAEKGAGAGGGAGERVETVVAEVSNTPWLEQHLYVLAAGVEGVRKAWVTVAKDGGGGGAGSEAESGAGSGGTATTTNGGQGRSSSSSSRSSSRSALSPLPAAGRSRRGSRSAAGGSGGVLQSGSPASAASSAASAASAATPPVLEGRSALALGLAAPSSAPAAPAAAAPTFLPPETRLLHYVWDKAFHVSPFMGMDQTYSWSFSEPGGVLTTRSSNLQRGGPDDGALLFTTSLRLTRAPGPLTPARLAWAVLLAFPLLTWRLQWWIHYEAVRLFRKGAPFFSHPTGGAPNAAVRAIEGVAGLVFGVAALLRAVADLLLCRRGGSGKKALAA